MDLFDDVEIGDQDEGETMEKEAPDAMKKLEAEKKRKAREETMRCLANMQHDEGQGSFDEVPAKRARAEDSESEEQMENIIVHTIRTDNENCTHEVAIPPNTTFSELKQSAAEPAKYYPFQLDAFQKQAILCIENNQSVLVSAHTSAGKTVVATYAIAQCLREKQRVIYTSPIKALSNQKYRELEEEFKDVGLMTGDVTINPDASCLVMTTEILRSMLYRGSEIIKEVGWVVYDEIHYMRDKERGVVWEETIILMSNNVKQAFLSATIPNAREFAQWVCSIKQQPVNVVYTDYRPTPLQHFIYPVGGDGMYEVVNVKGEFREDKFRDAMSGLATAGDSAGSFQKRRAGTQGDSNVLKIIRSVASNDGLNCIVFSFSRKECESYAISLKDMDFNKDHEKGMVKSVYESAISQLSSDDQQLPQIMNILPLLKRGIGVHHSGLMPILKETIEILFGEGLVKVLFATETFSMGLNMPARTVVFTSARKFDGTDNRYISSGEYIQMAGRAGRRGKDDRGTVILMVDSAMSADDAKQIIKGATDPLNSQFRLTYNMVLNLMRVEGMAVSWIIKNSFHQFQCHSKIPEIDKKCSQAAKKVASFKFPWENEMKTFVQLQTELENTREKIMKIQRTPKYLVGFLHAGRLLKIKCGERNFKWGILNQFKKEINPNDANDNIYVCDMIIAIDGNCRSDPTNPATLVPGFDSANRKWIRVPMTTERITAISAIRIKIPEEIDSFDGQVRINGVMRSAVKRMGEEFPLLDPILDMEIKMPQMRDLVDREKSHKARLDIHPMTKRDNFEDIRKQYDEKLDAIKELDALRAERKNLRSTLHLEELDNRKRVLRRLGYLRNDDALELKGRVACELSASDELILTEMLLKGLFNSLDVAQTAALLSCFVFQDNCSAPKLSTELQTCLSELHEQARNVAKVSNECKMELVEDKYVSSFNPGLMDVVSQWVSGASFNEIVKTTDVFEGSIIRCLRRLEEVLREMINAAKACSNKDLEQKFEDARKNLKRDIVFAASLYL
uniref:Superkiller viralicidic activity 2-like 2 n=1 Tax=Caenorhabditis tropicalis TaxID=1561998 RepID=A0A1I7TDH5_9PELO